MEHATQNTKVKHRVDVKQLVVLALLSAMGFISLFLVDIPVYGFLSYDFYTVPWRRYACRW